MSASLPDGAKLFLGTEIAPAKQITAITNANPPVATCTGHGYDNGDLIIVKSGWNGLNDRVFRVANKDTNTFELEGANTTNTTNFPPGAGVGSAQEIIQRQQIDQVIGFSMTGGEQQYVTYAFLEEDFERNLPSVFSAQSIEVRIADDPANGGFIALTALERQKLNRPLQLVLPNGSMLLYYGTVSFSSTPSVTKGEVMSCPMTLSLQGPPTRINA